MLCRILGRDRVPPETALRFVEVFTEIDPSGRHLPIHERMQAIQQAIKISRVPTHDLGMLDFVEIEILFYCYRQEIKLLTW